MPPRIRWTFSIGSTVWMTPTDARGRVGRTLRRCPYPVERTRTTIGTRHCDLCLAGGVIRCLRSLVRTANARSLSSVPSAPRVARRDVAVHPHRRRTGRSCAANATTRLLLSRSQLVRCSSGRWHYSLSSTASPHAARAAKRRTATRPLRRAVGWPRSPTHGQSSSFRL
jgi:hypothetical protein